MLVEKAYEIHTSVGLSINEPVTTTEREVLADEWQVQIHCFDINGVNPEFSYHSPKWVYANHLFILQDNQHFHFISNINGVLRNLKRNNEVKFFYDCFGIKFSRRTHTCREVWILTNTRLVIALYLTFLIGVKIKSSVSSALHQLRRKIL